MDGVRPGTASYNLFSLELPAVDVPHRGLLGEPTGPFKTRLSPGDTAKFLPFQISHLLTEKAPAAW